MRYRHNVTKQKVDKLAQSKGIHKDTLHPAAEASIDKGIPAQAAPACPTALTSPPAVDWMPADLSWLLCVAKVGVSPSSKQNS